MGQFGLCAAEASGARDATRREFVQAVQRLRDPEGHINNNALRGIAQGVDTADMPWAIDYFIEQQLDLLSLLRSRVTHPSKLSIECAERIIAAGQQEVLYKTLHLFTDLPAHIAFDAVCFRSGSLQHIVDHLDVFRDLNHNDFVDYLLGDHIAGPLVHGLRHNLFKGIDHTAVLCRLFEPGYGSGFMMAPADVARIVCPDPQRVAMAIARYNYPDLFVAFMRHHKPALDQSIVEVLYGSLADIEARDARMSVHVLAPSSDDRQRRLNGISASLATVLPFTRLEQGSRPWLIARMHQKTVDLLGNHADVWCTRELIDVYGGNPSDDMRNIVGVTAPGDEGLAQVTAWVIDFPNHMHDDDWLLQRVRDSHFCRRLFQHFVRFTSSPTRQATEARYDKRLHSIMHNPNTIDPRFAPSREYAIPLEYTPETGLTTDAVERYQRLRHMLRQANDWQQGDWYAQAVAVLELKIEQHIHAITAAYGGADTERARSKMTQRMHELGEVDLRQARRFEPNVVTLLVDRRMRDAVFQYLLAGFLHDMPHNNERDDYMEALAELPATPTPKAIVFVRGMLSAARLFYKNVFVTPHAKRAFADITSIKAFEHTLRRAGRRDVTIRFEPNRGVLMQYGDFIAQTCWLNNQSNFAYTQPNITTVFIRQNPGTPSDKLIGGFLTLQATTKEGEDLLIARSINPRETAINRMDVAAFYAAVTDYMRTQAAALGRSPAICLGGDVRAMTTNRLKVHQYMGRYGDTSRRISGIEPRDVGFNGYGSHVASGTYRL